MNIGRQRFDEGGTLPPPTIVEIEPTLGCNLRCVMCHVSYMTEKTKLLDLNALDSIGFIKGAYVMIGSSFEPSIHPQFNRLIDRLNVNENPITLMTNGTRLDRLDVPALYDANFEQVTFSFDGVRKQSYESIRRNASYEKTVDNITSFREFFASRDTPFAVNSTVMRTNLEETWETIEFWDDRNFDMLRLIVMVVRDANPALIKESLWPIRDYAFHVFDSAAERLIAEQRRIAVRCPWFQYSSLSALHPDNVIKDTVVSGHSGARILATPRQDLQQGAAFGMKFPCRSPFTYARVLWDGTVELCGRFLIGNLNQATFEDIWYGEQAYNVRKTLRERQDICNSCDYFKYCVQSQEVDVTRKDYYVYDRLQPVLDKIDFETGMVAA